MAALARMHKSHKYAVIDPTVALPFNSRALPVFIDHVKKHSRARILDLGPVCNENINLFYAPDQIVAGEAPTGQVIRAGGMVVAGSVTRSTTDLGFLFRSRLAGMLLITYFACSFQ